MKFLTFLVTFFIVFSNALKIHKNKNLIEIKKLLSSKDTFDEKAFLKISQNEEILMQSLVHDFPKTISFEPDSKILKIDGREEMGLKLKKLVFKKDADAETSEIENM